MKIGGPIEAEGALTVGGSEAQYIPPSEERWLGFAVALIQIANGALPWLRLKLSLSYL